MEIDEGTFKELIDVVRTLCERVQWHDEVLDDLTQKKITDRLDGIEKEFGTFTGGLNDIIDGRRKREYTDGFREKHPEFSKFEGFGKGLGLDVYGTAADMTYGKSDDELEKIIPQMLQELTDKFESVKQAINTLNEHEATETPAQESSEKDEQGEPEGNSLEIEVQTGGKPDPKILEMARRFKESRAG